MEATGRAWDLGVAEAGPSCSRDVSTGLFTVIPSGRRVQLDSGLPAQARGTSARPAPIPPLRTPTPGASSPSLNPASLRHTFIEHLLKTRRRPRPWRFSEVLRSGKQVSKPFRSYQRGRGRPKSASAKKHEAEGNRKRKLTSMLTSLMKRLSCFLLLFGEHKNPQGNPPVDM